MTSKLHQIIAVVAGKKTKTTQNLTECYHKIQKPDLFAGISRTYQPKDEDGEKLPPESKFIQVKVNDLIKDVVSSLTELYDTVATQDHGNCNAKADVEIDGKVLLSKVPVTHLLYLEKQLTDISTFVGKLPTLDPAESWSYKDSTDDYSTPPSETSRTKKMPRVITKCHPTKEHPAQVELIYEDNIVGYWKTVKFSGAMPARKKNEILERVRKLHEAVIRAREEANGIVVTNISVGKEIFGYIFG